MDNNFTMEFVLVTPQMASEWLNTCNKANRKIIKGKARQYATDMKDGKWQITPDGISFDRCGNLINGQHRLYAIVLANTPVMMAIYRNVDATIFDKGRVRSTTNTMAMSGLPKTIANRNVVSVINWLFIETTKRRDTKLTDAQIMLFAEDNEETLSKVRTIVGKGANHAHCDNAACQAAVFCALFNGVSEEVLGKFFKVVNTGFYDYVEETPAIVFRNYVTKAMGVQKLYNDKHALFSQCLSAINGYLNHAPRSKPYPTLETPYYFPSVKEYIKKYFWE